MTTLTKQSKRIGSSPLRAERKIRDSMIDGRLKPSPSLRFSYGTEGWDDSEFALAGLTVALNGNDVDGVKQHAGEGIGKYELCDLLEPIIEAGNIDIARCAIKYYLEGRCERPLDYLGQAAHAQVKSHVLLLLMREFNYQVNLGEQDICWMFGSVEGWIDSLTADDAESYVSSAVKSHVTLRNVSAIHEMADAESWLRQHYLSVAVS